MSINEIKFIDLGRQQKLIRDNINKAIAKVLDNGNFIQGEEVSTLEKKLSKFTSCSNVISCANGTDALTLVLMAWGVKANDAVFVPSFTYVSSAETVAQLGATPFFVDVDPHTFNICIDSLKKAVSKAKKIGLMPFGVIPVDLFGCPFDFDKLNEVAIDNDLKILIDSAQSFGSLNDGRNVGNMGHAATTSFFPAKPLGCYGDGGAIFTEDNELADIISSIRLHGKGLEKYDHVRVGLNSRLDTLQAAILLEKLKLFPMEIENRNKLASAYKENIKLPVEHQFINHRFKSVWAQYTIKSKERNKLKNALSQKGVPTAIYYPKPLHLQDGFKHYPVVDGGCKISSKLCEDVVSLPMHPYLSDNEIEILIDTINSIVV